MTTVLAPSTLAATLTVPPGVVIPRPSAPATGGLPRF